MISYAYQSSDRDRNSIIYATECTEQNIGTRYYCANKDCDAHLFICNLKNNNIQPYFRATLRDHPHVKDCMYAKINFKPNVYNEKAFDFEKATLSVMKPSHVGQTQSDKVYARKANNLPPHTIKQIYELAKSFDINFTYNNTKIWQLLAYKRTTHIYHKGLFRPCLVETIFAGFKSEKKYIRMKYYLDATKYHYIKLTFYNDEVFDSAVTQILNSKTSPVIIWGMWSQEDYYFKTTIHSLNQIYIP